ncbi:MAG: type II secretion system major pseudopilin GspG [Candidatus Sumerlaeia bacterium]
MHAFMNRKIGAGAGRKGFSFLEIMLVVVILGVMLAVVGPNLVDRGKGGRISATKQQKSNVETALRMYEAAIGSFPTTDQGLRALVDRPSEVPESDWSIFMEKMPLDAWKREFLYRCPPEEGRFYDLVSAGPDGQFGTEDDI